MKNIETKFNRTDKVWVLHNGKAKEYPIHSIKIEIGSDDKVSVMYTLDTTPVIEAIKASFDCKSFYEKECFATREKLIESL